uniref:Protein-tyrosine sulfotransferase n=1 Tax=Pyrodinium bahamense TaxID=73915 RepID=A0A7S0A256_9DINO|mmetsp:Transcript_19700/g.54145  ORF Transcript_19700/g.54145 Transcript_19700/m.54145 type:complete len:379 (+) Transcript_19700:73-1209(+)
MVCVKRALVSIVVAILTASARTQSQTGAAADDRARWSNAVTTGTLDMREARDQAWRALPPDFDPPSSWPTENRCFSTPTSSANGTEYCLPTILGICCMGAGTSSLSMYLNHHPNLTYGATKEHRFLGKGALHAGVHSLARVHSERSDAAHYAAEFPLPPHTLAQGFDFSPMYVLRDGQRAAQRTRALLGEHTRFLVLHREPIEAMCKSLLRSNGQVEDCPFKPLTEQEAQQRCAVLARPFCLPDLLQPWLEEFPLRQFWLMRTQELAERPQELLINVSRFLQLPSYKYPPEVLQSRMHVRGVSRGGAYLGVAARNAMLARVAVPRKPFDRCVAAQMAPGTYLSGCSARLEQLRKQRLELPATCLDDALHAEFMATLVR